MEFNENHKLQWWLVKPEETEAYICFLREEEDRHYLNIEECHNAIHYFQEFTQSVYNNASIELWQSAKTRHQEDIIEIDKLINDVKHWFKLEEDK